MGVMHIHESVCLKNFSLNLLDLPTKHTEWNIKIPHCWFFGVWTAVAYIRGEYNKWNERVPFLKNLMVSKTLEKLLPLRSWQILN